MTPTPSNHHPDDVGSGVRIPVSSSGGEYPVLIAPGLLDRLPALAERHAPAERYALVSDNHVAAIYGRQLVARFAAADLPVELFTFPAGEAFKSRDTWGELTDRMLVAGFGRESAVIGLGGGVTGDLAGFVAATFMRGIPVVQCPTSLLAMVDASVGGKTGVDVPGGKNLVGAFHPPRVVVIDPEVIRTLPRKERANGLAEVLKHGAILDAAYFDEVEREGKALLEGEAGALQRVVHRSVTLKAEVVSGDEHESGLRRILNFGHTLGHAIEAATALALSHGEAVALGMILEARLGERLGITANGTSDRLESVCNLLELPTRLPLELDIDEVVGFTRVDKKASGGLARYVLLERIGRVAPGTGWMYDIPEAVVEETVRHFAATREMVPPSKE